MTGTNASGVILHRLSEDISQVKFHISTFVRTKLLIRYTRIEDELTPGLDVTFQNCALGVQN